MVVPAETLAKIKVVEKMITINNELTEKMK
jgi:hypothetical protein